MDRTCSGEERSSPVNSLLDDNSYASSRSAHVRFSPTQTQMAVAFVVSELTRSVALAKSTVPGVREARQCDQSGPASSGGGSPTHGEVTTTKVGPFTPTLLFVLRITISASRLDLDIGNPIACDLMNPDIVARIAGPALELITLLRHRPTTLLRCTSSDFTCPIRSAKHSSSE